MRNGRNDNRKITTEVVTLSGAVALALLLRSLLRREEPGRAGTLISFAHRGGAKNAPENTLASFARGLADGANALEMDVHLTKDGEPVVIHDPTVDRTTDGSGAVSEMSLEELRGLDAGFRFESDGGHPYRGRGERIPTLREVLERFPGVRVNFEVKSGQPDAGERIMAVVSDCAASQDVTVASASHRRMRLLRRQMPGVGTSASLLEIAIFAFAARFGMEAVVPTPYVALQVPVEYRGIPVVTTRFIAAARLRGIRVDVWTIDEAREMRRLIETGVGGIMTDWPDMLSRIISEIPDADEL